MSVVKSSFRIFFSGGYLCKCVAVTDSPFFHKRKELPHRRWEGMAPIGNLDRSVAGFASRIFARVYRRHNSAF
jgi:hypothetical protein